MCFVRCRDGRVRSGPHEAVDSQVHRSPRDAGGSAPRADRGRQRSLGQQPAAMACVRRLWRTVGRTEGASGQAGRRRRSRRRSRVRDLPARAALALPRTTGGSGGRPLRLARHRARRCRGSGPGSSRELELLRSPHGVVLLSGPRHAGAAVVRRGHLPADRDAPAAGRGSAQLCAGGLGRVPPQRRRGDRAASRTIAVLRHVDRLRRPDGGAPAHPPRAAVGNT